MERQPDRVADPAAPPGRSVDTRTGYDLWSNLYDDDDNPLVALEAPRFREAIGDIKGLRVLDLGCGTGRHSAELAGAGARVCAVDFSEGMLERARAKPRCAGVEFLRHDLRAPLPWPDGAFDRVVCGLVLDHIAGLPGIFGEMRRVCRLPGGRAVVTTMHPAMSLLGVQARFTDPATGDKVHVGSVVHVVADYVMAALGAGWTIESMSEHAADAGLVRAMPKAARYEGWPMLLMFVLR